MAFEATTSSTATKVAPGARSLRPAFGRVSEPIDASARYGRMFDLPPLDAAVSSVRNAGASLERTYGNRRPARIASCALCERRKPLAARADAGLASRAIGGGQVAKRPRV